MKNIVEFITESSAVKTLLKTKGGAPLLEFCRATVESVEDAFDLIFDDSESTNYVYKNKFNLNEGHIYALYSYVYESEDAASEDEICAAESYIVYIYEDKMICIGKKFPEEYLK